MTLVERVANNGEIETATENVDEIAQGESFIVKGEDGELFDARIHKKMLVWLVKQNCAADFETHRVLAPMFSVEIDPIHGNDTTNGVTVKLAETVDSPSKMPTGAHETAELPSKSDETMNSAPNEPPVKPSKFTFNTRRITRSASTISAETKN